MWIILDLDETLISSSSHCPTVPSIKVNFWSVEANENRIVWVVKRPGLDQFLDYLLSNHNVGVWSAGQPPYVEAIVAAIFPKRPDFVHNWTHCYRNKGKIYKPLDKAMVKIVGPYLLIEDKVENAQEDDLANTIIVAPFYHRELDAADDKTLFTLQSLIEYISSGLPLLGYYKDLNKGKAVENGSTA